MALDLFLKPYKPKSRSKAALLKARQSLFEALRSAYPDTTLVGDAGNGYIENFPLGELHIAPDEMHWAMHGVDDAEPVHALADWFFAHGFACHDPQGAGFDRPRIKPPAIRASLDDLVGGQWLGFRFDRNHATALDADFTLADGRHAVLRMWHLGRCQVPELSPLVKALVIGTSLERGNYDTLSVQFEGGHALLFTDAVFGVVEIAAENRDGC
jgi:hypothetical protein